MAVNKVIYGGNTLIDLTGDTVTAADLADGVKATGADGNPIVGLMQKVTIDSSLSDTSTNPVQNKVIKAELDKKMAKTDKIYEANLELGGRNIVDGFSPIDASMVPNLGANRFAFGKAEGITVEYSTDAGVTWLDYGLSDSKKIEMLTSVGAVKARIGKYPDNPLTADCMLRVSIAPQKLGLYTVLNKFILYITTNGCRGCYCTIDASLKSTPTTFKVFADKARISGWSGWNVINTEALTVYQNDAEHQYDNIRFTFGCTEVNTNYEGLGVSSIFGFGGAGWMTPSNMAANGHLYRYNSFQDAIFPAPVTAPNFIGKVNGYTIEASVPANAKFTDTVYTHPSTHPASMITGLADVAKSGSYNDLTDKPTIPASATVDSELSSTSVNPVQNKVINAALNSKADSSALSAYLPLTGGTCTGSVSAPNFQTGTAADNYFQCRRFRGEGDANSYYHAIDFGYSGHDSVDFYEYDANWNFYQCTTGTKDGAVLVGNIDGNGWNGGAQLTGAPTAPTAAVGTNTTQIATTAFVANAISGMVKSVNGVQPDASGNVSISVSGGTNITVDTTLSATSTNAIANKAVYAALGDKLDKTGTADKATKDSAGNVISTTYIKTVNNIKPDSNGNVTISTSSGDGGGVSLSTQNTWTAQQNFRRLKFDFEKYVTSRSSGAYDSPSKTIACYNATGAFTLNMSSLIAALDVGESTLFTAYITSSASYSLSITNAGTLKYVGSASDLAITASGLLLNILIVKESSGTITSIAQATKLA